ncbi:MAG: mycothiol system anti-sigma-R factor [Chloroflexi bacterium]|nr:mycothiol system anti-sigma-R factor [Chloroflexota bacterium]
MNCNDTMERLQTYLDRELTDTEVGEVKIHLDRCPPCLDHYKFEEKFRRLVRVNAGKNRAPAGLREVILRRCQSQGDWQIES